LKFFFVWNYFIDDVEEQLVWISTKAPLLLFQEKELEDEAPNLGNSI